VTVQVKSTEQHFTVVLFIVLYKLVIVFDPGKGLQMKAIEQFTPVVLFIVLHKIVPTFQPVDEILWYDPSPPDDPNSPSTLLN